MHAIINYFYIRRFFVNNALAIGRYRNKFLRAAEYARFFYAICNAILWKIQEFDFPIFVYVGFWVLSLVTFIMNPIWNAAESYDTAFSRIYKIPIIALEAFVWVVIKFVTEFSSKKLMLYTF